MLQHAIFINMVIIMKMGSSGKVITLILQKRQENERKSLLSLHATHVNRYQNIGNKVAEARHVKRRVVPSQRHIRKDGFFFK